MKLCRVVDNVCRYCGRKDGEIALCAIAENPKRSILSGNILPNIYEFECFYCGCSYFKDNGKKLMTAQSRDHVIPKSRGGKNNKENIVMCCVECNKQKGSLMPDSFLLSGYLNKDRVDIVRHKFNKMGVL